MSGFRTTTSGALARATPRFAAAPYPTLFSSATNRTGPPYALRTASGSSSEALSTTISSGTGARWCSIVATNRSSTGAEFQVTTTTE